ncbi:LacI family DNA-binding transcriptional regulator [Ideonella sp. A 288]|uniref:LacI family DNA-binding transcriptional regulator n=1 Tax=Ideonella sp. A 288 TaxID=1962181 RepID=UPI000B4AE97D|nr:LacI family DNA-binding transcriptional regulator [Ideonella sp. A 288]
MTRARPSRNTRATEAPADDAVIVRQPRRGHGRPTLQDVATLAGVTSITVSRFLREPAIVAAPTAERIREALSETGYLPNRQAGHLASGGSQVVAALVPNLVQSIFAETVQGLSDGLQAAGHELLLAATGYSMEREEEQLRALIGWRPSAIVVTGRHHSADALLLLRNARRAGTPVIELWDQHPEDGGFTQIGFDHAEVGRAMAVHLLSLGHRQVAYVDSGVVGDLRAHERCTGFADRVRDAGLSLVSLTAPLGDPFDAGRQALRSLRQAAGGSVTAAAFANDQLACGALLEAQATGLSVPGELALMGFGDFPIGRQLNPGLSTIQPPRYAIGFEAAQALLQALRDGVDAPHRPLPWSLMPRGSTVATPA